MEGIYCDLIAGNNIINLIINSEFRVCHFIVDLSNVLFFKSPKMWIFLWFYTCLHWRNAMKYPVISINKCATSNAWHEYLVAWMLLMMGLVFFAFSSTDSSLQHSVWTHHLESLFFLVCLTCYTMTHCSRVAVCHSFSPTCDGCDAMLWLHIIMYFSASSSCMLYIWKRALNM